jgi:hypothetical protein
MVTPQENSRVKPYYMIEYELFLLVNGDEMQFEARYPPGGETLHGKQICIAAAFKPGVK